MEIKRNRQSRLNYDEVLDVLKRIGNGEKQLDIARHYNVSPATITFIKMGRTYSYATLKNAAPRRPRICLGDDVKIIIKQKLNIDYSTSALAKEYGVSASVVSNIKNSNM